MTFYKYLQQLKLGLAQQGALPWSALDHIGLTYLYYDVEYIITGSVGKNYYSKLLVIVQYNGLQWFEAFALRNGNIEDKYVNDFYKFVLSNRLKNAGELSKILRL